MKIIIAGVGPGKADLISLAAVNAAKQADLILVPRPNDKTGVAEKIISQYVQDKLLFEILFPMTKDSKRRSEIIREQIEKLKSKLNDAENIFFPVIGDSVLYSTGAYLIEELKKFFPEIEVEFIPGISAHSLACACAKKFMAMSEEIFCVIPGTADSEKILNALKFTDSAAIYKPTAIKDKKIFDFIKNKFSKIIRVDFAGLPNEKISEGSEALENINEYLSIILLMV
ncbi:MAG: precorrin-2 C(20)-methyltransferase [Synergistaceae bacterium]|nr:precorrin-2 C(20)-methyltransferase [Synergistaceae bacterium]